MTPLRCFLMLCALPLLLAAQTPHKRWTVADGLPTGKVHQIVELPNGQMLVNGEGVFCLSNGRDFSPVPCAPDRAFRLPHFLSGYAHWWQGDSLLWLRDFYQVYLFDVRTRSFRHDFGRRMRAPALRRFVRGETPDERPCPALRARLDSLGLGTQFLTAVTDRQGGLWAGTPQRGILYLPPARPRAEQLSGNSPLIGLARSTTDRRGRVWRCKAEGIECDDHGQVRHYHTGNVPGLPHDRASFVAELPDGRYLLCDSLNVLGYFVPERHAFVPLAGRLPALKRYRRFVGACPIDPQRTAVYAQNGAFLLDTAADTLAPLPGAADIERHSHKYNCMLRDRKGRLWVGTQNGLFAVGGQQATRIEGLANHCIRSLVTDARGRVWAGTSNGISRITPTVVNYGPDDGIPAVPMMERAACLAPDGRLVFAYGGTEAVAFRPEWLDLGKQTLRAVLTGVSANGQLLTPEQATDGHTLPYNGPHNLLFRFSALNYASPAHTRYRYRMRGLEREWQTYPEADGSQGTAEYRALPPGTYTFEVQAALDDGAWGPPARQALTLLPPMWLTWWAKGLYALAAVLLLSAMLSSYLKWKRHKLEQENDQRVNRLFELREEARHQFAVSTRINARKISVGSEEEALAEQMLKAIEAHLGQADYSVDQLAQDTCMSRSALYAKLKNMLGISPADFIRNVRLKQAARLLAETDLPVGEVAMRVGYSTHKAFAANFKKAFGHLPSDYRSLHKEPLHSSAGSGK